MFLAGCVPVRSDCGRCLPKLFKQIWLAICFSCFLGRAAISPPFRGTSPGFLGRLSPSFRGEAEARLCWETGPPLEAGRGEISLCPVRFRSPRMTFPSLSFKARVGLLASPSLFSLPLQNTTRFKAALCLKNSQHLALLAYRSASDNARGRGRWGKAVR